MTVDISLSIVISAISVAFAIYTGLKNSRRASENDISDRIARETRTDMKLDEIGNDVKEIKETVKTIQEDVKDHEGRIVKLEASYKAEHKRLDEIFDKLEFKDKEA